MIPVFSPLTGLAGMVRSLFSAGEPGVWYDPSDLSTLFQDAVGTVPVTAMEQPVGLILDKSNGLMLGPELIVNSAWTTSTGWSVDTSTGVATAIAATGTIRNKGTGGSKLIAGKWYQATIRLVSYVSGSVGYPYDGTGFTSIPTTPGTYTYRFLCDNPNDWTYVYCNAFTGVVDNISVRELPGNHATQSTTTRRPTLKQDASGKYYLSFDGVDDYLSTGSIDFTATDKMTVLSGARAFDGHIYNTIVAQNYPNSPSWYHLLKRNLPSELSIENGRRGSGSNAFTNTPNDLSGLYDGNIVTAYAFDLARTPELVTQRVNGAVKINGYGIDSGVGPLANAPLYIGSINATQHRLTGNLYGLIVRGAQTDDAHLTHAEKYLAHKSGVTL